ncbi:hypothetical protein ACFW0I_35825 [[Kitasatospora] papulosa]|uniref:hypothetical protein n=1 Tax=[Kitasatospora] papulosa TaxID=1464011 RepID=UPI0036BCA368
MAVAKMAFHGRERLGLLRVVEDAIVIHMMRWPDEIRDPAELAPPESELDEGELKGALALLDTMSTESMPGLHDEYRESLEKVIAAKAEGRPRPETAEKGEPAGQMVDLMAALNASVEQAKERRGEPATVHRLPKKTPAKKQVKAPKKTAAVKKASGRKPRSA